MIIGFMAKNYSGKCVDIFVHEQLTLNKLLWTNLTGSTVLLQLRHSSGATTAFYARSLTCGCACMTKTPRQIQNKHLKWSTQILMLCASSNFLSKIPAREWVDLIKTCRTSDGNISRIYHDFISNERISRPQVRKVNYLSAYIDRYEHRCKVFFTFTPE